MKKTLLLSCTSVLMAVCANAQISIGPVAGLHITRYITTFPSGPKQSREWEKNVPDMQAGAIADMTLNKRVHLQSGLLFTTNSYKYEGPETKRGKYSYFYNIRSLELPVNITLYTGMKDHGQFFFSAGAFLSCNVSGRMHTKSVETRYDSSVYGVTHTVYAWETEEKLKFGKNKPDNNGNIYYRDRRLGAGVDLNAGYRHKSGIFACVYYQKELRNQLQYSGPKRTSSNYGLSLGYLFHTKKKVHTENKEKL